MQTNIVTTLRCWQKTAETPDRYRYRYIFADSHLRVDKNTVYFRLKIRAAIDRGVCVLGGGGGGGGGGGAGGVK